VFLVGAVGATLDLKKTSFKKLTKLLSVHEKKGLLSQVQMLSWCSPLCGWHF
jgi:hypothetical protein